MFRNAVEHDGEITVRVGRLPDGAGLYVEDDGIGVPAGDRERIFRGGYSTSDHGTGSGLAVVRQVADTHRWGVVPTAAPDSRSRESSSSIRPAERVPATAPRGVNTPRMRGSSATGRRRRCCG
nr:HAMP domain-containing sensor histidine kinase [Halobellus ruber]